MNFGQHLATVEGRFKAQVWREVNGVWRLVNKVDEPNLVVDTGLEAIVDYLDGVNVTEFDFVAIGTDSTSPTANDTGLGTEVESRVQGSTSQPSATQYRVTGTQSITGSRSIQEAGLFNASSGGTMFSRVTFSSVALESGDSFQSEWTITVS